LEKLIEMEDIEIDIGELEAFAKCTQSEMEESTTSYMRKPKKNLFIQLQSNQESILRSLVRVQNGPLRGVEKQGKGMQKTPH